MGTIFKWCLCGIFFIALIFKLAEYIKLRRLVVAGMNMSATDNELAKQLKRRFTDCFTLNKPINNTLAYVEKSVDTSALNKLSLFMLSIFYLSLFAGMKKNFLSLETLLIYGFFGAILYYTAVLFFDTKGLRNLFVMSATDYLDNTLKNRLTLNNADKRRTQSAPSQIKKETITPESHKKPEAVSEAAATLNNDDSALIASIIDEFIL